MATEFQSVLSLKFKCIQRWQLLFLWRTVRWCDRLQQVLKEFLLTAGIQTFCAIGAVQGRGGLGAGLWHPGCQLLRLLGRGAVEHVYGAV